MPPSLLLLLLLGPGLLRRRQWLLLLGQLRQMGFVDDEERLRMLLAANDNDVQRVLNELFR